MRTSDTTIIWGGGRKCDEHNCRLCRDSFCPILIFLEAFLAEKGCTGAYNIGNTLYPFTFVKGGTSGWMEFFAVKVKLSGGFFPPIFFFVYYYGEKNIIDQIAV